MTNHDDADYDHDNDDDDHDDDDVHGDDDGDDHHTENLMVRVEELWRAVRRCHDLSTGNTYFWKWVSELQSVVPTLYIVKYVGIEFD